MNIEHLIVCKGSSVDQESQAMSVFEMIEHLQVQSPKFPVNIPMHSVFVFRREEGEEGVLIEPWQLSVIGPNEQIALRQSIEVKMEREHNRQRVRFNFPLPVEGEGSYRIRLSHMNDNELTRSVSIDIKTLTDISKGRSPNTPVM